MGLFQLFGDAKSALGGVMDGFDIEQADFAGKGKASVAGQHLRDLVAQKRAAGEDYDLGVLAEQAKAMSDETAYKDAKKKNGLIGGALGGVMGAVMHDPNKSAKSAPTPHIVSAPSGAGQLGNGYRFRK